MEKINVKDIKEWVKKNKLKIAIGGTCVAGVIIYKTRGKEIVQIVYAAITSPTANTAIKESAKVSTEKVPHEVAKHIRNLHPGWNASPEKIATAARHGFELKPGQTWVETYKTGKMVA